ASPCPGCGGKDRFRVWPESDRFWCRQCNLSGNNIEYLKQFHSMTVQGALQHLGIDNNLSYHQRQKPIRHINHNSPWIPNKNKNPPDTWKEKAMAFVDWSQKNLLNNSTQLEWLDKQRGLNINSVINAKLGWNPLDMNRTCQSWGYPELEKDIFIPHGLIIPVYINGKINRVKTRSDDREIKYLSVTGSGSSPMIFLSEIDTQCIIVVESELDALLIHQECGDLITAVAMGSASYKPDIKTHNLLIQSKLILQSFDAGDDEPGANISWSWWRSIYPQWRRWPCVNGKDPTESYLNGFNIRAWIQAGLDGYFPESAFEFFDFLHKYEKPLPNEILNHYGEAAIERMAIMTIDGGIQNNQLKLEEIKS
ncbi:MAG TPA: hypothetical protein ENH82_08520, partial [bacterium]|nr:hypothetical protein [bacterium]